MSQQKFASNVVEKCLTFGDPSERQLLVNEMLGSTDENEPLQVGYICFVFYNNLKTEILAFHFCKYLYLKFLPKSHLSLTILLSLFTFVYEIGYQVCTV